MNAETAEKDKNQTEQAQEETKAPEASAENQANKPETESSKTADKNTAAVNGKLNPTWTTRRVFPHNGRTYLLS